LQSGRGQGRKFDLQTAQGLGQQFYEGVGERVGFNVRLHEANRIHVDARRQRRASCFPNLF